MSRDLPVSCDPCLKGNLVKRILLILALVVALFALAMGTAQAAADVGCPTEGWTETVTVPSARNPRLDATQTTTVVVTGVYDTGTRLTVDYVVTITTHDQYAINDQGRRGVTVTETFGAQCVDDYGPGDPGPSDPPSPRDPWCGSPARCALIEAIYDQHRSALET